MLTSYHPETARFRCGGVNLWVFLCGVKYYASAPPLISLPQRKIARFQSEKFAVALRSFRMATNAFHQELSSCLFPFLNQLICFTKGISSKCFHALSELPTGIEREKG